MVMGEPHGLETPLRMPQGPPRSPWPAQSCAPLMRAAGLQGLGAVSLCSIDHGPAKDIMNNLPKGFKGKNQQTINNVPAPYITLTASVTPPGPTASSVAFFFLSFSSF